MTGVRIRKIDIDDLRCDEPPSWGKVSAVINGIEVRLTLSQARIDRLLDAVTPVVMEVIDEVTRTMPRSVVIDISKQRIVEAETDPDALTGCADDQTWADVPTTALRAALAEATEAPNGNG